MKQRPLTATIFGILNIGFGLFALAGLVFTKMMEAMAGARLPSGAPSPLAAIYSDPNYVRYMHVVTPLTALAGMFLIAAGIGLLLLQNWARIMSIIWAIFDSLMVLVGVCFTVPMVRAQMAAMPNMPSAVAGVAGVIGGIFGVLFGLAYPVVLMVFMLRPTFAASFREDAPPPVN